MTAFLAILLFIIPIFFLILKRKAKPKKQLPPGSLGLPFIGQSITLLRAMRANTAEKWLEQRVKKYGQVSKMSLFGKNTVFIYGQAANKLVFASESGTMTNQQTTSVRMILGDRNLLELSGDDHKRVRDALVSFLRPDCLKQYVGKIEGETQRHLDLHWHGKDQVTAANKLVFASESGTMTNQQTTSVRMILGDRNLLELSGDDHKRVRDALVSFLRPDCLKQYVGKIEGETQRHLDLHWHGKDQVTVLPLMKILTFNIICTLLFGLEIGPRRDELISCFQTMIEGMWSVPINLPFTRYNRSLRATVRVREIVRELIHEKSAELTQNGAHSNQDLITCLLGFHGEDGEQMISEDEIVHNIVLVMVAGHDTSSVVITFIVRLLANEPSILEGVVQEQEQIAKKKSRGELLTWEDLSMMKYTWRVAMETLRVFPPIFGGFRRTSKDIEFGGYIIPQGWQVFWVTSMTHMDGNIFQEPSKFDPKRFENQAAIPPYCFVPFGGGARICPGYEFARIEILVALHYLVTRFTWKLCCKDDKFSRDPMPVPTQGLPIQLAPKKMPAI